MNTGTKIILFDGVCNLCSAFLRFVYFNDPGAIFTLGWLQSDEAADLQKKFNLPVNNFSSILYIEDETVYSRTTAFLKIVRQLRWPWPVLWIGIIIPGPIRDWLYDMVARNRYKWFGKKDQCLIPTGDLKKRFL